jgi:hypothetical protein
MATFNSPIIQIDGTLQPCCGAQRPGYTIEPRNDDERCEAARWREEMNVLNHPFTDLLHTPAQREFRLKALKNRYAEDACVSCIMPADTLGRLFDGTELEAPRRPEPSADIVKIKDLRIDADYMARLLEQGLQKDIDYYRESGVLSPEAELLLKQHGQA